MDVISILIGAAAGFIIGGILAYYAWDKALRKKKAKNNQRSQKRRRSN
jgi:ribonucrease Y